MKHISYALLCAAALTASVASAQVASVNVVGYTSFDVTGATDWQQLPVQFKDATDGTAAKLTGIGAANGLVANDLLMVLTSNGGASPLYAQYKWNGSAWIVNETYVLDANGNAQATETPAVNSVTFGIGSVLWFKRGDGESTTRSLSLQGEVTTAATSVALATGYNLVANPNPTDSLTLSNCWTGAKKLKDQLLVQISASNPKAFNVYQRKASGWSLNGATPTESITIPAGCVMWYVKDSASTLASISLPPTIAD